MAFTFSAVLMGITDFGDSAVIGAATLTAGAYLFQRRCVRQGSALLLAFLFAVGGIGLAKLLFLGCSVQLHIPGVTSPSGHAALSAAFYGMLALVIAEAATSRWLCILTSGLLIALIAATRVILGFHTIPEILVGLLVGLSAIALAWGITRRFRAGGQFSAGRLLLAVVITIIIFHGDRLPVEALIRLFAFHLKDYATLCNKA